MAVHSILAISAAFSDHTCIRGDTLPCRCLLAASLDVLFTYLGVVFLLGLMAFRFLKPRDLVGDRTARYFKDVAISH